MKKIYKPEKPDKQMVMDLIASGVKVNAQSWKIIEIEIDDTQQNITQIEQQTGIKFKEVKNGNIESG